MYKNTISDFKTLSGAKKTGGFFSQILGVLTKKGPVLLFILVLMVFFIPKHTFAASLYAQTDTSTSSSSPASNSGYTSNWNFTATASGVAGGITFVQAMPGSTFFNGSSNVPAGYQIYITGTGGVSCRVDPFRFAPDSYSSSFSAQSFPLVSFAGGNCNLVSGTTYQIQFVVFSNATSSVATDFSNNIALVVDTLYPPPPPFPSVPQVVSVISPTNGTTTSSTSVTFTATVFNDSAASVVFALSNFDSGTQRVVSIPLTASGLLTLSTTTVLDTGFYKASAYLYGGGTNATNTIPFSFNVVKSSSNARDYAAILAAASSSVPTCTGSSTADWLIPIVNFGCSLIIPHSDSLSQFSDIATNVSGKFPFAYFAQVNDIRDELYNSSSTASSSFGYTASSSSSKIPLFGSSGPVTFVWISASQISAIPYSSTIQLILTGVLWLSVVEAIYLTRHTLFK